MTKAYLTILLLLPFISFGQIKIKGRIISQKDTKSVANVNVFISNATIGDRTDNDGIFTLENVKPGKYELVASFVGFEPYRQNITIGQADVNLGDITLYPKSIGLAEVKIKAKKGKDYDRERNLNWFKEEFLGTSNITKSCIILNPEQLDLNYDEKNGLLTGSSADFLIIENKALGYRLKYLLSTFILNNYDERNKSFSYAGTVFFESMHGTPQDEQRWKSARKLVYEGSELHFLRSILEDRMEEEGFRILRIALTRNPKRQTDSIISDKIRAYTLLINSYNAKDVKKNKDSLAYWIKQSKLPVNSQQKLIQKPLKRDEILKLTKTAGVYRLSVGNDALFVTYDKYGHFGTGAYSHLFEKNNNSSVITFNKGELLFDNNGTVLNPTTLSYEGVWSGNRVATLMPVDYGDEHTDGRNMASGQINSISNKLKAFIDTLKQEKTYVQFDKPCYAIGDTIYFKAYVTQGASHIPTQLSGIVNVELINGNDKIQSSVKLQINNGGAAGDFVLADSLKEGRYRIKAYTNWMRNEGDDNFFEKSFAVGSISDKTDKRIPESGEGHEVKVTSKKANRKVDVQFLPEGGTLVVGNYSKVAFKAVEADGLGIDLKGMVVDDSGVVVCAFASSHLGMGVFSFVPEAGKTYKANITYPDSSTDMINLPKAVTTGYTINLNSANPDTIRIRVTGSNGAALGKLNLIAQQGGVVYYAMENKPGSRFFSLVIPKNIFPTGIVQFTLFNEKGEPLNERLSFVNNNDQLKLTLKTQKMSYAARQKVTLTVDATDMENQPVAGNFSIVVVDESRVPADSLNEQSILSSLLLTSELKGNIEQPDYYFTNKNEKINTDLDILMLTQGYRHFKWKDILDERRTGSKQPLYNAERSLMISGFVRLGKKPLARASVKLFTKGKQEIILDTITNADGHFVFNNLFFTDTMKYILQARTEKGGKNVDIELEEPAYPIVNKINITGKIEEPQKFAVYLKTAAEFAHEQKKYNVNQNTHILNEVVIKDQRIDPHLEHSQNLNGPGNADQVITSDALEKTGHNLYEALQLLGHSMSFNAHYHIVSSGHSIIPSPMAIVVDGNMMDQPRAPDYISPLQEIEADDVESVEIGLGVHYGAIYGSRAAGGVIIVTTKRARKLNEYYRDAPGVMVYIAKGFYKAREFYSPQYDNSKTNQKMADLRSTIYWNPNVITDKNGKASFSYFNADGKGTYRVIIEGIDADGNLGRAVYRYRVE